MFRTVLTPEISTEKLRPGDKILTVGSCFSEMMGEKLRARKFDVLANPFGILYNPVSQHRLLRYALQMEELPVLTAEVHERFFHFDAHSRVSGETESGLMHRLGQKTGETQEFLGETSWLILTYGTALIYQINQRVVANCHKQPSSLFSRKLLSLEEMHADATPVLETLFSDYPDLQIIVTVSPIRHIRDTLQMSSVSKSLLRIFCHELDATFEKVHYFPSYEILMDDLRDYRFYDRDMIHPNASAEDYIFDKFAETYFGRETRELLDEWSNISKALSHRPFNPDSSDHKHFLKKTLNRLLKLSDRLNVQSEIELIEKRINE